MPVAVRASSGKQVLCGYGDTFQAVIFFEEETGKKPLEVRNNIQDVLQKYGDEKLNPKNRERVKEIHVFSPKYKFNHELIFVDTPGLDAYELGIHEEITLKMVLPAVDMILYCTVVKCDSDRENLNFIDRATSDLKPFVAVQNKIDSILSDKISTRGVEKTREEIREEHYLRLKRLLSCAQKKAVREAPIVQISAKNQDWDQTNLATLNSVLNDQVAINRFHRDARFFAQFMHELESIENVLSSKVNG